MRDQPDTESREPSRRRFLKGAGAAAAAGSLAAIGITTAATSSNVETNSIDRWIGAEQVVTAADVDVGYTSEHPKEPAAFYYNGTYYLGVVVWDAYDPSVVDNKDVVLMSSPDPAGPFTQISQVTARTGQSHALTIVVDDSDELWLFVSERPGSTGGTDDEIVAYHQSIGSIGSSPSDWTNEGAVISVAKDPAIVRASDDTYYMFYQKQDGTGDISRQESTDLVNWSNEVRGLFNSPRENQAVDVIPRADGTGYWMTTTDSEDAVSGGGTKPIYSTAARAGSLTATTWEGNYFMHGTSDLNGIEKTWYSDWLTHIDYTYKNTGKDLHYLDGDVLAYFEGGDGSQFSVGAAIADSDGDYY